MDKIPILLAVMFCYVLAEEVPFSYENNRIVKMLDMGRTSKPIIEQSKESSFKWNLSRSGNEFEEILNEMEVLKLQITQLKLLSELDEIAEKCVSSIKRRNELKAQRHWDQIMLRTNNSKELNETESTNILRRITVEAYDGFRDNILPVVHFINYTKDLSGLSVLLEEMIEYGHLYGGTEVFLFARLIRTHCGISSLLYQELPSGIQYVDSYSVLLLNENNDGALYFRPKVACRGRHCTSDEVFTFHGDLDKQPDHERSKTTWTFEPTNTSEFSDNIKFHLKNEFGNQSYFHSTYYTSLSDTEKSVLMVHLVNNTEDAIRIRVEQNHLVKRLIMGGKNTGSNTIGLSIMHTEDRFDKANDGNWVVHPIEMVRDEELDSPKGDSSYKCVYHRVHPEKSEDS